jgi:hypothetical protein
MFDVDKVPETRWKGVLFDKPEDVAKRYAQVCEYHTGVSGFFNTAQRELFVEMVTRFYKEAMAYADNGVQVIH